MDIDGLALRAKEGDQEAICLLVEKLRPIRLSLCKRFYSLEWEDLEGDLVLVLLEAIQSFDPARSGFAWYVRQLSLYFCFSRLEDVNLVSWEGECVNGLGLDELISDGRLLEEDFLSSIEAERVRKAMEGLGEREREVIFLYYFQGLKLREIAELLNLSVSCVSKAKCDGEKFLRRVLK